MDDPVAANVLGTAGAICWSIQLLPQIIINYRRHNTIGLQPTMMMFWAMAGLPLGVYNILRNFNIALQVQPQILTFLSLVTWGQCRYYSGRSIRGVIVVDVVIGTVMSGIEVGLVFALRKARRDQTEWPMTLMAVLSAVCLAVGVLRHYLDIYQTRSVRGISFLFVSIDAMGDLTSMLSVFFQQHLDILGLVIYGTELALWVGMMTCGVWLNLMPWLKTRTISKAPEPMSESTTIDVAVLV